MTRYKIILLLLICSNMGFSQSDNFKQMRLFNKLWKKIDNNYASFELKGINWQESYDWIKPKITKDLTQEQLMDTLSLMLSPFNDGHVGVSMITLFPLDAPKDFIAERKSQFYSEFSTDSLRNELFGLTNKTLLDYGFEQLNPGFQNDNSIIDFVKSDNIGYMHISHMERITKKQVKEKMKYIVHELSDSKGLIIDVRDNKGGLDGISDLIASYLIDTTVTARYEQVRKKGDYNSYTEPEEIKIHPKEIAFTKQIVIVANDRTRSAGEYFVLALKDIDYITIVGDRTEGMIGGSKIGILPYGWIYGVNKWKVTSRNHIWYEDIGIPPDFFIQNKISDIESNFDPVIKKAISLIDKQ